MKRQFVYAAAILWVGCSASSARHGLPHGTARVPLSESKMDRQALLRQDLETFDQAPAGLRSVYATKPGCREDAADIIAAYRLQNPHVLAQFNAYLLLSVVLA